MVCTQPWGRRLPWELMWKKAGEGAVFLETGSSPAGGWGSGGAAGQAELPCVLLSRWATREGGARTTVAASSQLCRLPGL